MRRVVACLFLVAVCVISASGDDKPAKDEPAAKKALTINLHFPADTKYKEIKKILDELKPLNVEETNLIAPEKGKGVYAEILGKKGVSSKEVAAVVGRLLHLGISKIAIEVKQ